MRLAKREDAAQVGRVVGEAFAEDPVSLWTLGSPDAIVRTFGVLAEHVYLVRGGGATAETRGGAMWLGPGGSKALPLGPEWRLARDLLRLGGPGAVLRALAVDAALRWHRPSTPHYYLFAVGVSASGRGQGLGAGMIGLMTAQADRDGLPCWLENTNPRNAPLYERLGFEAVATFSPVPGCPVVTTMRRAARPLTPAPARGS